MVYKNFSNYDLDLEHEKYYSFYFKKEYIPKKDKDGYAKCGIRDDKGNLYNSWHQVVYCAIKGITKDEFPRDEKGRVYEIDHIIPIRNGGTNDISNLRLVSKLSNSNNPMSIKNMQDSSWRKKNAGSEILKLSEETKKKLSEQRKGKNLGKDNPNYGNHSMPIESRRRIAEAVRKRTSKPVDQIDMETGEVIRTWESAAEAGRNGFCAEGVKCCAQGKYKHHHGYLWKYILILN